MENNKGGTDKQATPLPRLFIKGHSGRGKAHRSPICMEAHWWPSIQPKHIPITVP